MSIHESVLAAVV